MIKIDNLGKRIRENRERLEMTQEDLADRLHVDISTIANWEHERSELSADDLYRLHRIFHKSMEEIYGEEISINP